MTVDVSSPSGREKFGGRSSLSPPRASSIEDGHFLSERYEEYMMSASDEVQVFEDNDSSEGDDVVILSEQELYHHYLEENGYVAEQISIDGSSTPAMERMTVERWSGEERASYLPTTMMGFKLTEEQYTQQMNTDSTLRPLVNGSARLSPSKAIAKGNQKPSTPTCFDPNEPSIKSACELVQQIYDQIALHDSPAVNDQYANNTIDGKESYPFSVAEQGEPSPAACKVSSQRHDTFLQTQKSQVDIASFDSEDDASNPSQPGLLRQELQLQKLGAPPKEQPKPTHSYFKHLHKQPDSKMGHVALGTLCSWTLETLQASKQTTPLNFEKEENENTLSSQTPVSTSSAPNNANIQLEKESKGKAKGKWSMKSYWKKKKTSAGTDNSAEITVNQTKMAKEPLHRPETNTNQEHPSEMVISTAKGQPPVGYTASILVVTPRSSPKTKNQAFFAEDRMDEATPKECGNEESRHPASGNSPQSMAFVSAPSSRLQMFGSEYARHLSTSALAPKIKSPRRQLQQSASSRYGPFSSLGRNGVGPAVIGIQQIMNNASFGTTMAKTKRTGNSYSWNLEDQDSATLAGAIVDICITNGTDTPPPKGYYRISQTIDGEEFNALCSAGAVSPRRKNCTYINVKKEPNWHRAAQRPCVTAIAVIFPDRQEFVPPGFCVVREYRRRSPPLNHGGRKSSSNNGTGPAAGESVSSEKVSAESGEINESIDKDLPANFNQGSVGGERVYLCFRRSREGNPITGILPLQPAFQEAVPDGYTVIERTPRNFVASLNPKSSSPIFLAYRQRLANLEPLRPLPLILSITVPMFEEENDHNGLARKRNKKPKLNAYYCTGGTVVEANVGRYHIMDRSTHALLSPSSVANRLSLIELSRRKSLPQLANNNEKESNLINDEADGPIESRRPIEINTTHTVQSSQGGDSVASSTDLPSHDTSFSNSIAEYPKNANSSFSTTGSFTLDQPTVSSCITEESAEIPSVILSSFPSSNQQADGYYPKLYDSDLKMAQDAMNFIPIVETSTPPSELEPQRHLRARTTLLTPILTACYQRHGGAALKAVEGLTKLLKEADFFADDVDWSSKNAATRLTLLDLALQTVCDVATGGTQETTFGACVEFVENAVQYCQGHLNTRTIGYVLRFYLFVYYFGASIPSNKPFPHPSWGSSKDGQSIQPIIYDPRIEENRSYLSGGAPQMAALGFKDLITLSITRLQSVCLALPDDESSREGEGVELESMNQFFGSLVSSLIDGAVHRVDAANYTQLAMHQIHRSGGSELFWHDMMTSCGMGLFGNEAALTTEALNMYVMTFTILANVVKVASGRIKTNAQTLELRARDVSSKLLSLELLLHFLEQYNDKQESWMKDNRPMHQIISRCIDTMVFCVRRLVVPCLLANSRAGLEDPHVFGRMIQIISLLWRTPLYRERMKGEMGMLIEHFGLRLLRLGPQLQQSRSYIGKKSREGDSFTCPLLMQQLDLLKEIKRWFSSDPKSTIEMYLNFDTDLSCSQETGPSQLLPGTQWKVFQRICANLCYLAEQCGDLIGDQIRQSQSLESPAGSSKHKLPGFFDTTSEAQSNENKEEKKAEMESIREGARLLRTASLDAIVQILKVSLILVYHEQRVHNV